MYEANREAKGEKWLKASSTATAYLSQVVAQESASGGAAQSRFEGNKTNPNQEEEEDYNKRPPPPLKRLLCGQLPRPGC